MHTLKSMFAAALAVSSLVLFPSPGAAHEYWLTPSAHRARSGDVVTIGAWNGESFAGEPQRYGSSRVVSFRLHAAREVDLTRAARDGDTVFARFAAPDDSGAVVSLVTTFSSITLPADRFDAYLESDGLDGPRAARAKLGDAAGPGRERFRRCCKTWIAGVSSKRITRDLGLPMEITPLADPAKAKVLRLRVTFEGRPLAGALVNAWWRPARAASGDLPVVGPLHSVRSGPDGTLELPLTRSGEWLVSAVHMVPSRTEGADWESSWASLTFERP